MCLQDEAPLLCLPSPVHASCAAVDTSRPGSLVVCFTCISPLPLRGLTRVTWVLSSDALGMEWRCPLPEWEGSRRLSSRCHCGCRPQLGPGKGRRGTRKDREVLRQRPRATWPWPSSPQTQKSKVYPRSGGSGRVCVRWRECIPSQDTVCREGSMDSRPGADWGLWLGRACKSGPRARWFRKGPFF